MFEWLYTKLTTWLLTFFAALKSLGDSILIWLAGQADTLLPDAVTALGSSDSQELLSHINYFFPLSEAVVLVLAYAALWVLVLGYKLVKSWIPTVSS